MNLLEDSWIFGRFLKNVEHFKSSVFCPLLQLARTILSKWVSKAFWLLRLCLGLLLARERQRMTTTNVVSFNILASCSLGVFLLEWRRERRMKWVRGRGGIYEMRGAGGEPRESREMTVMWSSQPQLVFNTPPRSDMIHTLTLESGLDCLVIINIS